MKKLFIGLIALCMMLAMGLVGCSAPEEPSGTEEGEIYRTKAVTSGSVGAYFSFKVYPEGEKNEWDLTGNVYEMNVSAWGREYSMWNAGYWELDGDTLSLTPTNQDEPTKSNPTLIVDATVNEAKTFTAVDGAFIIPIKAYGEDITIVFNPETDKVGETSEPPCASHVDEDDDGKCDVCGEDMPTKQPSEGEVQVLLTAQASIEPFEGYTVTAEAKLELYTDETWAMSVKTDADPSNPDFAVAAGGTYTVDMTTYAMTLTVTEEAVEESLPETFTVNCDISGYPELAYSAEVTYTSAGFTFDFVFTNAKEEPMVTLTGKASASPYEGYTVNAEAKLDLYENNTWVLLIKTDANPAQTDYQEAASGTWALDSATYVTTLTVTEQLVENSLSATFTIAADYSAMPTIGYSASITYTNMIAFTFALTGSMIMGV